jgi:hypothetical protein
MVVNSSSIDTADLGHQKPREYYDVRDFNNEILCEHPDPHCQLQRCVAAEPMAFNSGVRMLETTIK